MKQCVRKGIAFLLSAVLIFSMSCNACAVTYKQVEELIELGTVHLRDDFDMWHYSGGYWLVGDNYNSWRWTDAQVGEAVNIGATLGANTKVSFKYTFPSSWINQFQQGDSLRGDCYSDGINPGAIYNTSGLTASFSNSTYTITMKPKFNISSLRTFDDYVAGLQVCLPLINSTYGCNLYSIFRSGSLLGRADGWFDDSKPVVSQSPYVHPMMIKNSTGALKDGYTIETESGSFSTSGLSVGTNTLVKGGALGLQFYFPLKVKFMIKRTVSAADYSDEYKAPDSSDQPSDGGGGGGSGPSPEPEAEWRIHRYR